MQGKKYEKPCSYLFKKAYGQNSRDQQFEKIKEPSKAILLPSHPLNDDRNIYYLTVCII